MARNNNAVIKEEALTKMQEGKILTLLFHMFQDYNTFQWSRWEINVQLLAKVTILMTADNKGVTKIKYVLIKLQMTHGKDDLTIFTEMKQHLEVETFSKLAKDVKDLL
eukprot:2582823-Ditylum_brightwellii.AAC.1